MTLPWKITGEFLLSCNCDLFCPCVLSLGKARPTQGACYSWWGLHISRGHVGATTLDDINVALLMEAPGPMEQGNWTVALYLDERASPLGHDALTEIFTGRAGGPLGWWSIMIATVLGPKVVPIAFERQERGWRLTIPKALEGVVEPVPGAGADGLVRITNSRYWVSPDVVVSTGTKSRIRDWGRNWDFTGKSAEYAQIDWCGP